ncbi:MAG: alpha-E domain-containing protein [Tepidisphaerales bacterium]
MNEQKDEVAMLSRTANAIYWMSRYIERAENVARAIDVNHHMMLDMPGRGNQQWMPLVTTTGDHADFIERYQSAEREHVIEFMTLDPKNPNSIASCIFTARENARGVRPAISGDMWEYINRFYLMLKESTTLETALNATYEFCTRVRECCHLVNAATDSTMSHGEPWRFAQLGRMLERADQTSRILDVKYFILLPAVEYVNTPLDSLQWSALLKSVSGYAMYRRDYGRIDPHNVVKFLLLDDGFPRAVRFCVAACEDSMRAITGSPRGTHQNEAERLLGRLRAQLDYQQIREIMNSGLHEYLDQVQSEINAIDSEIYAAFFQVHGAQAQTQTQTQTQVA